MTAQLKEGAEILFKQGLDVLDSARFLILRTSPNVLYVIFHSFCHKSTFPRWSWLFGYKQSGSHTSVLCTLVFVKPKFYTHSMWPVKINLKETCKFNQESPFADLGVTGKKLPRGSNSFIFIQFCKTGRLPHPLWELLLPHKKVQGPPLKPIHAA